MLKPINIAVLVSGSGSNLQALLDAQRTGALDAGRISLVVSDRPGVYALERARAAGVKTLELDRRAPGMEELVISALREGHVELIVLAGFLTILSGSFVQAYAGRILNVHPSLLPSFGGRGFYGLRVHQAALARGVKVSGATVHLVTDEPDGGPILLQKAVRVRKGDTPQTLQRRIMEQAEWQLLPRAAQMMCKRLRKEQKHAG